VTHRDLVYFDIETAGKYKDLNSLMLNDSRGYNLFLRKIERKSSQILDWQINPEQVYLDKSPLIPEFGRIVCVSIATFVEKEGVEQLKMMSICDESEEVLIRRVHKIFNTVSNKTLLGLCGFYIKGFDIPYLNRKFLQYDLKIPKVLKTFNVKPWEMNVVDLAEVWKSFGTLENVSLDEMLYVLDVASPKSIMAGKDVHYAFWNNNIEKIRTYCEADVMSCVEASKKIIHLI
jgi:predicted PolB exonuclease-like 3'-5' exonuclease